MSTPFQNVWNGHPKLFCGVQLQARAWAYVRAFKISSRARAHFKPCQGRALAGLEQAGSAAQGLKPSPAHHYVPP